MGTYPNEPRAIETYRDAHLELDYAAQTVRLDGRLLGLTRKEYDLLVMLVSNAGEIMNREQLLWNVWNYSPEIRTRTLDVHIRRLRRKLGSYCDQYIETIFGIGYRFQPYRPPRVFALRPETRPVALGA